MKRIHFFASLLSAGFLLAGCSSAPKQAITNRELSKTVATILARTGAAPLAFKDGDAAREITASIADAGRLQFAVLLDKDLKDFGKYFAPNFREKTEFVESVQERIRSGNVEFNFERHGVSVSVAPVRTGNEIHGYAAVGAL